MDLNRAGRDLPLLGPQLAGCVVNDGGGDVLLTERKGDVTRKPPIWMSVTPE